MNLWQPDAAEMVAGFIKDTYAVEDGGIKVGGSLLNEGELDIFSDVDMEVSLAEGARIDVKAFISALSCRFGGIFGYETHIGDDGRDATIRVCFENGWRFDFSFARRAAAAAAAAAADTAVAVTADTGAIESVVEQFWFMASMVLVKLGRRDHLIAAHLALELCQLAIVVQMLARDAQKGTNIHRFGGAEDVPVLRLPPAAPGSAIAGGQNAGDATQINILNILVHAAEHMDNTAAAYLQQYTKRSAALNALRRRLGI